MQHQKKTTAYISVDQTLTSPDGSPPVGAQPIHLVMQINSLLNCRGTTHIIVYQWNSEITDCIE